MRPVVQALDLAFEIQSVDCKMQILLTNDDGVFAPGLRALRKELLQLGEVTVVAPAMEQSGVAHSITLLSPLVVKQVEDIDGMILGWMVEGSPADSVKLGICELMPRPPDLIVSGINSGSNVGINVLYSGTVAAAIRAPFSKSQASPYRSNFQGTLTFHMQPRVRCESSRRFLLINLLMGRCLTSICQHIQGENREEFESYQWDLVDMVKASNDARIRGGVYTTG